ncbi:MAG: methionine synthase, partial [Actinobacteria bacterium]|nr:methionine synthase [Actinomycetota bacterium]
TEALLPLVQAELVALADAGCEEVAVDEPSMSCYAHQEDPERLVDVFNRTVGPVVGRTHLSTHLCFGNYRARAVAPRRYAPMFPAFLELVADEIHLEMASRELAEAEVVGAIAERKDVAVGVIDVKSYYVEPPDLVAGRIRHFLRFAPPERLAVSTDCGLSQTARWAARAKLRSLVAGAAIVRGELGL